MAITLSAMSSMQIEIKKLLNIRKLREEKAQKHYELQVGLHQAALEKKAAQENLIMQLENAYVSAQSNFQQYQLNNVFNMEEVRSFQITQDKKGLEVIAAKKQLINIDNEIEALKKDVETAYQQYMDSIKAKQKIETVLKEKKQEIIKEASKQEDKKLEEVAELLKKNSL